VNVQSHDFRASADSAFRFTGSWREFAPIAFTNLLLTIVTLGVYRFWAKARERRYLWSRTEFIDDSLEWTGTGGEMFKGFLIVMAILLPAVLFLQFGFQAMVLRGQAAIAGTIAGLIYIGFFFLAGVARYRALRYRLSRTYWHGIRGGGEPGGWGYGVSYLWRTGVGILALGLLIPWSMTQLWNERWRAMSFGPDRFEADATARPLMGRYLCFYLLPFLFFLVGLAFAVLTGANLGPFRLYSSSPIFSGLMFLVIIFGTYALTGLIALAYYSAYLREAIGALRLGGLRFSFEARTGEWVMLLITNTLIVVATLGIGYLFLSYRNWAFMVRHLEAEGHVDLDGLTQSRTNAQGDAEGLAAAFDVGAI
jgi:uncharacterized membrane protein YjgN (DUF898 family)